MKNLLLIIVLIVIGGFTIHVNCDDEGELECLRKGIRFFYDSLDTIHKDTVIFKPHAINTKI